MALIVIEPTSSSEAMRIMIKRHILIVILVSVGAAISLIGTSVGVYFGYPDGIVDGLSGRQAKDLRLPPSIVFNGACYTGVTHCWFEQWTTSGTVSEQRVASENCFCRVLPAGACEYF